MLFPSGEKKPDEQKGKGKLVEPETVKVFGDDPPTKILEPVTEAQAKSF